MAIDWSTIRYFARDEFGYAPGVEPDPDLVRMLDASRRFSVVPFVITSGIRTPEHNASVGGKPNSAHLTGHAVDIKAEGSAARMDIVQAAITAGFERIGIGSNFVHLDTSPNLPQGVMWLYS